MTSTRRLKIRINFSINNFFLFFTCFNQLLIHYHWFTVRYYWFTVLYHWLVIHQEKSSNKMIIMIILFELLSFARRRGIVVMDFDCYTGDRGSIPAHSDSLGNWMNLRLGQPMPCEGNRVVSPKCWWDIDLQSVNNCKNGLLSLLQFNHRENRNTSSYLKGLCQITCKNFSLKMCI